MSDETLPRGLLRPSSSEPGHRDHEVYHRHTSVSSRVSPLLKWTYLPLLRTNFTYSLVMDDVCFCNTPDNRVSTGDLRLCAQEGGQLSPGLLCSRLADEQMFTNERCQGSLGPEFVATCQPN